LESLPLLGALASGRLLEVLELGARLCQLLVQGVRFGGAIGQPLLETSIFSLCGRQGECLGLQLLQALGQCLLDLRRL
ncbi:hypothetical protein ABTE11_23565, partial [Acinetobacter baumannii]